MVFITKILVVATLIVGFFANNAAAGAGAAVLIQMADKYGAPFAETATSRLHGNIFGAGRATRSTDVVIFNKSSKAFKLSANSCEYGGYSTGLFPEHELQSKQSSVFGIESNGFATGVTCTTRYTSSDGTYFELFADNPYIGKNVISETYSPSLSLLGTKGQGDNNEVRWIVEDS